MLGSLPMAHKRQSTSSMVLISSPPLFFSGSLVVSVTSRPPADLLTDLTCVFFHKSIPEFSISFVQFALIKLSKVLNTCVHRRRMRREMMCDLSKININIIQINNLNISALRIKKVVTNYASSLNFPSNVTYLTTFLMDKAKGKLTSSNVSTATHTLESRTQPS